MAADVKLTPLGAMVLALLREGDMHPYEMMRLLRQRRDDRMVKLTNGTFYHTVGRLEREGLIAEVGTDRDGNRPERTTYTLQPAASDVLENWVRTGLARTDSTPEFRVALAEAHNLPRAEVIDLVSSRRAALAAESDTIGAALAGAAERRVPHQFLIETDRHAALLRAELTWTDGFLESLADASYAWGIDEIPAEHRAAKAAERKAARQ
ncbi:PadR family transcriptional regulator [Microbacterium sp. KUDC0406]|uniref:PadR family transcriptional regulator n=1 Tax=Microbacterium sp. KUDC0406 TaxID=2909588 RepID=UPI001F2BAB43|nr:PadR family transcriptional regulator [Microbacterium sp. KUDC0406]UJP09243.1 PadR family transcriptional regulator [Microbacterium sp. KUDC0406]